MMKTSYLAMFFALITFPFGVYAHTDTILRHEGTNLIGLPEEYAPATFDWDNKVLQVGKSRINLTSFENVIPPENEYRVVITASWYHQASGLPPYIGINFYPTDRAFSYTILLNLNTLELIKVSLGYRINMENYERVIVHELKIHDRDLAQIRRLTTKVD